MSTALVVFSGTTLIPWLRVLKRGFRHCFVLVPASDGWIALDPLAHRLAVGSVGALAPEDVAAHYTALGCTVVAAPLREPPRRIRLFAPFTCVEAVKRIIGLDARGVWTPWQLYCALANGLCLGMDTPDYAPPADVPRLDRGTHRDDGTGGEMGGPVKPGHVSQL